MFLTLDIGNLVKIGICLSLHWSYVAGSPNSLANVRIVQYNYLMLSPRTRVLANSPFCALWCWWHLQTWCKVTGVVWSVMFSINWRGAVSSSSHFRMEAAFLTILYSNGLPLMSHWPGLHFLPIPNQSLVKRMG